MQIDDTSRRRGDFPVDQPMQALKDDHALARRLFDRYFQTQDEADKRDAGTHVLLLLEMHASLEEGVFYPRVRDADATLIGHCILEHEEAKLLIEQLKPMDGADQQAQALFRQLADAVLKHIDEEEQQLFPKVEQARLDMSAIGHEMMSMETMLAADHAQRLVAPGLRQ